MIARQTQRFNSRIVENFAFVFRDYLIFFNKYLNEVIFMFISDHVFVYINNNNNLFCEFFNQFKLSLKKDLRNLSTI